MRYRVSSIRVIKTSKACQPCLGKAMGNCSLRFCWWGENNSTSPKGNWLLPSKIKNAEALWPTSSASRHYPTEILAHVQNDMWLRLFSAAWLQLGRAWNNPRVHRQRTGWIKYGLSAEWSMMQLWKNEDHSMVWNNFWGVLLSEKKKPRCKAVSIMCNHVC